MVVHTTYAGMVTPPVRPCGYLGSAYIPLLLPGSNSIMWCNPA